MTQNDTKVFKDFGKVELFYKGQKQGFLIDLSTLFGEDRIIPGNATEYPYIIESEDKS